MIANPAHISAHPPVHSKKSSGGGTIAVQGNATVNNTFDGVEVNTYGDLLASFTLWLNSANSSGTQTLSGTGNAVSGGFLDNMVIETAGAVALTGTLNVVRNWAWESGTLNANPGTLNFINHLEGSQSSPDYWWQNITGGGVMYGNITIAGSHHSLTCFYDLINVVNFGIVQSASTAYDAMEGGGIAVRGDLTMYEGHNFDVLLNGSGAQSVYYASGASPRGAFTINKSGGVTTFTSNLASGYHAFSIAPGSAVEFSAGSTYTFPSIAWNGTQANPIVLRSTITGTQWKLNTINYPVVTYVDVKDSDASGGTMITAFNSTDSGNNLNWFLGAPATAQINTPASSIWVVAIVTATFYHIQKSRGRIACQKLLGAAKNIIITDRWGAYARWPLHLRQICWAHLRRDFQRLSELAGACRWLGLSGKRAHKKLFSAWHDFKAGVIGRRELRERIRPLRAKLERALQRGRDSPDKKAARFCRRLLKVYPALWTFVDVEGVEPTNNHAERMGRPAVLWRKCSFGNQSDEGCYFSEVILTVIQTLRMQKKPVLDYLTRAVAASRAQQPIPNVL